ncbi:YybH family protein [Flavobacterium sp. N1994]|uniref:YybH family protein n=1 Tax=Flavobacterium sp. N1994 TaxID=2986827 RepID=UPI002222F369|nr:nuclear transport factor 2 family protein [Flavobacterium sp. N1994]
MKNKILNSIVFISILAFVIGCKPKTQEVTIDKVQIKNDIQAIENKMAEMYNNRELVGEEYYADDATSFSQNKPPLVGKSAIDQSIKEDLANFQKGNQIAFVANEIFPSNDGNQVIEVGSYRVSDSTSTAIYTGNYMALFEKRDGKYVCIRDMAASDRPKIEIAKPEEKKEDKK